MLGPNDFTSVPCSGEQSSDDQTLALFCWMTSSWASAPTSRLHARFEMFLTLRKIFSGTPVLTVSDAGAATTEISASAHGPVGGGAAGPGVGGDVAAAGGGGAG